ncbi:MAG: cupin domain-containing protein [Stellaceae bacterium]
MSIHPRLPTLPAGRSLMLLSTAVAAAILLLASRLLPVELGRGSAPPAVTMPAYLHAESTAGAPAPTATVVSSDALPHVAGKRVTTVLVEFPPGGFSPEHHHAGSVSVYVLSGEIESQLAGGPAAVYKPGDMFFEPPGAVHLFARNMSTTEPARILAVFVHDEGAQLTTYH